MRDDDDKVIEKGEGLTRRNFLKVSGISLSVPLVLGPKVVRAAGADVKVYGPGKVPISLAINGKSYAANVEPRVTLLEALRNDLDLTGAKRVCDRATCGACTVIVDGKSVYSCSLLAVEAQGKQITTVEGLMQGDKLHPLQQAFIDNDAQQCGFCTPGFVVACKAFLDKNPNPTPEQVQKGLGGNLCRCGTYMGVRAAVLQAANAQKGGRRNG
ncbi:MAG TPA: (2Fe-2S)-binding protein [Blastocatellia bacterium]|nr:(2Fe-2S)-binding protein [Blastocatellia bacterium]